MKRLILVDACNLFHRLSTFRDRLANGMDALADQLLSQIRCLHDLEHWEIHIIIDGTGPRMVQQFPCDKKTLSFIYSATGQPADTIIETWLLRLGQEWSVKVVSEDRAVMNSALAHAADVLNAQQLIEWADRVQQRFNRANSIRKDISSAEFENRLEGLP